MTIFRISRPIEARLLSYSTEYFGVTLRLYCRGDEQYWIYFNGEISYWTLWRATNNGTSVSGLTSGSGGMESALACLIWGNE